MSLLGNMITITKPTTFTVAVVDNAAKESTSGWDCFTVFTIDSTAQLSKWIDNTAPKAEMKFEKGTALYQRMGYIRFSDQNQPVTLDRPIMALETAAGDYQGWYKRLFNTNESIQVLFHDAAGNSAIADFAVSDISSTAPVLTKSWSPFRFYPIYDPITHKPVLDENGDPILEAHHELAPSGPLNGDVTVTVSSNMPTLTAEYSTDMRTWVMLTATPVAIADGPTLVRMGDSVVATYSKGGPNDLHLKFTAPNGKSTTETIQLYESVIDKTAPTFTSTIAGIKREGATKPYAATITLTPNETVTCSNYNTLDKDGKKIEYSSSNPIKMTVTKDGDYPFHLLDLAGNSKLATVKVAAGIDRKAPMITTDPDDTTKLEPTKDGVIISVTTDEACTVTCGKQTLTMTANTPRNITITENGSYAIVATDPAGNVTIKSVNVGSIDKLAPTVSFDTGTISVRQDSKLADLKTKLASGVTVQDNMTGATYLTDAETAVTLGNVGTYAVTYTTDTSIYQYTGHTGSINRMLDLSNVDEGHDDEKQLSGSVMVQDILFGCGMGFVGVHFSVAFAMANFVEALPQISGKLEVNTINDWAFAFSGGMELASFAAQAKLSFKSHGDIPVPDEIYFFIGGFKPSINIDACGVLWITGGGGISDLSGDIRLMGKGVQSDIGLTLHKFNLGAYNTATNKAAIVQLTYDAASMADARTKAEKVQVKPNRDMSGTAYNLVICDETSSNLNVANANVSYDPDTKKATFAFTVTDTANYEKDWYISTGGTKADVVLYNVDTPPEVTSVSGTVAGQTATLTWDGSDLGELDKLSFYLSPSNDPTKTDNAVLLTALTEQAEMIANTAIIPLPASLPSGDYYVRAVYSKTDEVNGTCYSTGTIRHTNAYLPADCGSVTVKPAGNLTYQVTVPKIDDTNTTGYRVTVYNADSSPTEITDLTHEKATGAALSYGNIPVAAVGETTKQLTLAGVTSDQSTFQLTPSHVSWVCQAVEGDVSVTPDGQLTAAPRSQGMITGRIEVATNAFRTASLSVGASSSSSVVAVSSSIGGSVTGGGTYNPGDTVTLSAVPDGGYVFSGWTVEGVTPGTGLSANPLVFTMPTTGNVTVSATFSPIDGGSTGSKPATVKAGTVGKLPLPPNADPITIAPYYVDKNGKKVIVALSAVINGKLVFVAPADAHYSTTENPVKLSDIAGNWAERPIRFAAARGLFEGVGNDLFNPAGPMTRSMFVTVLHRMAGSPEPKQAAGFADVSKDAWYAQAVAWASENAIVSGYSSQRFGSDDLVTREQMCVLFARYLRHAGYTLPTKGTPAAFADAPEISAWAKEDTAFCRSIGLMQGKPGNRAAPKDNAARAEGAAMFTRLIESIVGTQK